MLSKIALPRISDVIEERKDTITDDLDEAKSLSIEAQNVVEDLRIKLDEAKIQSQKNLMDERQRNLEKISLKRKEFEDKVSKDILSSESKINKSKSSALVDISSVAEDIAEEMLNNLFVKKVEKKDLSKFSKNLN
jgi:F-type H+-transporting ATPase subunit b|tara:strand:+ start:253 stop:657 length:405 start_codon:yes stop_codon:yes gene_type:complete